MGTNIDVKNNKKPSSVISVIVVFAILSIMAIFMGINAFKQGRSVMATQLLGIFYYIGFFCLLFKQYWAKVYSSIVLCFLFLIVVGTSILRIYKTGADLNNVFLFVISISLLGWLCYAFIFGNASREYFRKLKSK